MNGLVGQASRTYGLLGDNVAGGHGLHGDLLSGSLSLRHVGGLGRLSGCGRKRSLVVVRLLEWDLYLL